MFGFLKKKEKVAVTAINLKWQGSVHNIGKIETKGKTFEVEVPFQNKKQSDYNISVLKVQKSPPIKMSKIEVKTPFKIISIDPALPVSIEEEQKTVFKLKIEAPDYGYEGPLNIELSPAENPLVHLELPKIVVNTPKGKVELKDSPLILDVQKGQILKQTINMQKITGLEGEVNSIAVKPPFTFINSEPKVPFKTNPKQGYLIFLYVQAPQQNYAGPLELDIT